MLVTADRELERHSTEANLNCIQDTDARTTSKFGATAKALGRSRDGLGTKIHAVVARIDLTERFAPGPSHNTN